jgi:translation initiation factor 2 subunit 3
LEAKGVNQLLIVQNKIDLVSKEDALKQNKQIRNFTKGTLFENAKIIPVCAQQGINIDKILEEIDKLKIPDRDEKSEPLFFIARSFDINRPGAKVQDLKGGVLGGVLKQGKLKVGDIIEIKPGQSYKQHDRTMYRTVKTKILGLRAGNNNLDEAKPSGSLAIQTALDPFMTKADSLVGCVAGSENKLPEITYKLKMKTTLFKEIVGMKEQIKVDPLKSREPLMLSVNTTTTVGFVDKVSKDDVDLLLKIPIVPFKGSRIGVARNYQGHWRLIGWGEII